MKRANDLSGVTVIVTRPKQQAAGLCRAVEERGGRPVRFPAVIIEPVRPPAADRRTLETLARDDWAVFTSVNAVQFGLPWFPGNGLPPGVRAAAVGAATAKALRNRGVRAVTMPREGADSEALLQVLSEDRVRKRQVALVKGRGGRRMLGRGLRRRGARVINLPVYRRERPDAGLNELADRLPKRGRVVTTVTSGEILNNLLHLVDAETLGRLKRSPLVVISDRVAGLARWSGFTGVVVAGGPGPSAITDAAVAALRKSSGPGAGASHPG